MRLFIYILHPYLLYTLLLISYYGMLLLFIFARAISRYPTHVILPSELRFPKFLNIFYVYDTLYNLHYSEMFHTPLNLFLNVTHL